ncbi:hypothetical protein HJG60_011328 [Phyllostomus discolor]|uniref:Uncharacterized protein n=1 Tax=Phyllostomus discolor TaxID=89673 RepID=A0A834A4E7_9CHIR|nr:hypothetical protein HJG60_011328 [Phyllostomus discolor]
MAEPTSFFHSKGSLVTCCLGSLSIQAAKLSQQYNHLCPHTPWCLFTMSRSSGSGKDQESSWKMAPKASEAQEPGVKLSPCLSLNGIRVPEFSHRPADDSHVLIGRTDQRHPDHRGCSLKSHCCCLPKSL